MVPNGWEKHPVGKLCKSIVPGRNKPKVFDGDIPWVTTPEISGKYIPSNKQKNFISQVVAKECGAKVVPKGAVVIAAVGELGLTAIATEEIILNQQLHAFVCPNDLDNEYLAYFLSAQKPYMNTVASKTTIPYMNKSNCESIPVLLPPLPEQRKIAKTLSTWDKAISTTEKLIETSKQQKKALMQQLLTGKKRLVNPETGKVFEGEWEEFRLSDLTTKITKGTTPSTNGFQFQEGGINFVKVESILKTGQFDVSKFAYIDEDCHLAFKRSQLEVGDILFSIAGALGRTAIVTDSILPANTNQALSIVRLKKNTICSVFILQYLNSSAIAATIKGLTAQAAQPNLSLKDVGNLPIRLPNVEEQQKIASVLTAADKEIEVLEAKLAHFKQEKKALMQQLLTGKRRVKVDEEVAA
ncbi:restriction endonuclease subunit S (plasmid) [Vibrio alginolyticus]|uniref:restriction endonuclease subunit S n=1 Tax=Vibrio alginolyticus TaxID=663 RepID=UPI000CE9A347|nr:restriction endonuclease subunit S [Vibrio alginolyticus]AVF73847.1 restriction endonuclease subunit S [Vibrio alginolyticus]